MTTSESRSEPLRSLLKELDMSRSVHFAPSVSLRDKVFEEICSSIRIVVKEQKPRTDSFRTNCRIIQGLSFLSPDARIRQLARDFISENRHIFRAFTMDDTPSRFEPLDAIEWSRVHAHFPIGGVYRFSTLDWVLSVQGAFLQSFRRTNDSLMSGEGPLPRPWRHFIAMMGASRFNCEYLVRHELEQFMSSGGDPGWLTGGVDHLPKKLVSLFSINSILAHRPWAVEGGDIEAVIAVGRWSASELVHALVILATYQSMPALVFGAGVRLEEDLALEEEMAMTMDSADPLVETEMKWLGKDNECLPSCFSISDSSPGLIQRLIQQQAGGTKQTGSRQTTGGSGSISSTPSVDEATAGAAGGTGQKISAYEGFGALHDPSHYQSGCLGSSSPSGGASYPSPNTQAAKTAPRLDEEAKGELASIMASSPKWRTPVCSEIHRICSDIGLKTIEYRDFTPKTDHTLHSTSFSWEDHGMMVMERQAGEEVTQLINDEYLHAIDFSTNSIGDRTLESTRTVREAIVKYVQRMYGIFHDDYRYDRLNKILPVIDKAYLKKLACYPDRLSTVDYMRLRKFEGFSAKDLIHLAHLVSQTKRVVTLTWAMHALVQFQSKQTQH